MATRHWIGSAAAIAEKKTITVGGTWASGDTITLTVGHASLVLTVGTTTTTSAVASNINAMLSSNAAFDTGYSSNARGPNVPEFAELESSVNSNVVTVTHKTRGVPFSLSAATSGSGTLTVATTQAATGPNHWNESQNWSGGTLPASGDDVVIDSPVNILYGINQASIALNSLTVGPRFGSSSIGLPRRSSNNYTEYRQRELAISATTVVIYGASTRIRLNLGTSATNVYVYSSGTSSETGAQAVQIVGANSSNTIYIASADVGIAPDLDQSATFPTITLHGGILVCGKNATLGTITMLDAAATLNSNTNIINAKNSRIALRGGTHSDLDLDNTNVSTLGNVTLTTLRQINGNCDLSPNTSWTTINKLSGTLTVNSGGTTLTTRGGNTTINSGNITTLNAYGGTVNIGECSISTLNANGVNLNLDHMTTQTLSVTTFNVQGRPVNITDSSGRLSTTIPYSAGKLSLE